MGTKLVAEENTPQITHHAILRYIIEVPHKLNATQDDIVIDRDNVSAQYTVVKLDSVRRVVEKYVVNVPFADWTAGAKADASGLLNKLEVHAKANGHIASGTDEVLDS